MTKLRNLNLRKKSSLSFFLILLVLLFTVFTHWGNRLLLTTVSMLVPNLSISLEQGALLFSPRFKHISYRNDDITFNARQVSISWRAKCFLYSSLCLNEGTAESINIKLTNSMSAGEKPSLEKRENHNFSIRPQAPWPLKVNNLRVENLTISNENNDVRINNTVLSGAWETSKILVNTLMIKEIDIKRKDLNAPTLKQTKPIALSIDTLAKFQHQVMAFIWPKIDGELDIQHLSINRIDFMTIKNESVEAHKAIDTTLIAAVIGQQVERFDLNTVVNQTPINLHATATLNNVLPLKINIKTELAFPEIGKHALDVTLNGNLEKLSMTAVSSGLINGKLALDISPLKQYAPIASTLNWQPFIIHSNHIGSGKLNLKGNLSSYDVTLESAINNLYVDQSTISLQGTGTLTSLSDIELKVAGKQGSGLFSGDIQWDNTFKSSGAFTFNRFKFDSLVKQLPALIDGTLIFSGEYNQSTWQLNLPTVELTGDALTQPFSIHGAINAAASDSEYGKWRLNNIVLSHGENTVELTGTVDNNALLKASIDIKDLANSLPYATSKEVISNESEKLAVHGQIVAHGKIEALILDAQLRGKNIIVPNTDISVKDLAITASTQLNKHWINAEFTSSMTLKARGIDYKDIVDAGKLDISINGDASKHHFNAQLSSDNLNAGLKINGALFDQQWRSTIQDAQVSYLESTLSLSNNIELLADIGAKDISLTPHCWVAQITSSHSSNSNVCLAERFTINTSTMRSNLARLEIENAKIENFQTLLPPAHQVTGPIDGFLTFQSFNPQALSLAAQVTWHDGTIISDINDNLVTHHIDSLELNSAINRNLANVIAKLSSPTLGKIDASMLSNIYQDDPFVSGHINSQGLQLAPYKPFLRYVSELEGELSVSAGFTVDADSQQIFGTLSSNDITIASEKLPNTIDDLNTNVVFNGTKADLTSQFKLAQGHGDISGNLDWSNDFLANLVLNGESLKVMPQNGTSITFSPQLELELTPTLAKVRGNIIIEEAQIAIESLPESAVAISPDVIVTSEQTQSSGMAIDLDVNTQLGNALHLTAFGLESLVGGELNIKQNQQQPLSAYGELALSDATYKAFGQHLMLEQGQIIFTGSVNNPVINIKAIRDPKETNDGVIAGVYVNGDANQPALTVFSEPVLEQQQAISYLLRGYGLGTDSKYGQDLAIAMLVNSGLGGASGAVNALGDAVGIDNLNVTTSGSGDQTRLEFSGFIGPKLQLRYGVGVFDALPEVGLRYQVNRRLFVEFINNTDQALDLLYQFSFD